MSAIKAVFISAKAYYDISQKSWSKSVMTGWFGCLVHMFCDVTRVLTATWAQHKYKRICLCLCLWSGVLPCLWVHLSSSEKQTFKKYVRLNQCKKKKTLRVNGSTFPVKLLATRWCLEKFKLGPGNFGSFQTSSVMVAPSSKILPAE